MNLKLRLKNKGNINITDYGSSGIYLSVLGILNVVVPISQNDVVQVLGILINLLGVMGILVDPTTPGVGDSELAKSKNDIAEVIEYKKED